MRCICKECDLHFACMGCMKSCASCKLSRQVCRDGEQKPEERRDELVFYDRCKADCKD
jgi:hypothetical protein